MSRTTTCAAALAVVALAFGTLTACGPDDDQSTGSAASPSTSAASTAGGSPSSSASAPSAPSTGGSSPAPVVSGPGKKPTGLPASVWVPAADIPTNATSHWGSLAQEAAGVKNPRLEFEQLCGSRRDPSVDLANWHGPAAQSTLTNKALDFAGWKAEQTVIHFPGTDNSGAQTSYLLFQALQKELTGCAKTAKGATAKVTTTGKGLHPGDSDLAATLTVPESGGGTTTVHEYLALTGRAVLELAVYADHPAHPWSAPSDRTVLKSLESPVCPAFKDCNGG